MRSWLHQKHEKRVARIQEQAGAIARDKPMRDPRSPHRPRSPGTGTQARPYQNRLKRETTKNIHFNKTGVYIETQVGEAPPSPTGLTTVGSDTSDSGKGPGKG